MPKRYVVLVAAALLAAHPTLAQQPRKFESVLSYRTVQVAQGIYAFITPEERTGFQAGNSIAIIGDDGVLVVDTGNLPGPTRRQIAELRRLTDKPVRYVVNTHWHPDHTLGNREYRAAFPGVIVIGTSATRDGILERVPGYFGQIRGFLPTDSVLKVRLATGKTRDGAPLSEAQRVMWRLNVDDFAEFYPEVMTAAPSAPDLIADDSLTILLGQRAVKVISPGRGNTAGDTFVFVPDARVLVTGDLVTVPGPFPSSSFTSDWIRALDRLKAMNAAAIVPGHGEVQHDYGYIDLVRELLVYTRAHALDAARRGLTFEETLKAADFSGFVKRFAGDDLVRTDGFNSFYVYPGMQRAWEEAKFSTQGPVPKAP